MNKTFPHSLLGSWTLRSALMASLALGVQTTGAVDLNAIKAPIHSKMATDAESVPHLYGAEIVAASEEESSGTIFGDKYIRIINLGPIINFSGLDYAPAVSVDGKTLYYVSNRPGSKLNSGGKPSHDFWLATKADRYDTVFNKPVNLDTTTVYGEFGINTAFNEGVATISADQQTIYFTGCNRADGLGSCDLYMAKVEGDQWGKPTNLGPNVNSAEWDSQPSIAPDGSRLYFASQRPGGEGEADIWYCDWDADFEQWKPAINAGKTINTSKVDWSPFIGADNQTLFFASSGHKPSYGGTDFYYTVRSDDDKWSQPKNLGPQINTSEDEFFISLPGSGDIVYWASKREDVAGYQGDFDIFMAFVPSFFRSTVVSGFVKDECTEENIPAIITYKNLHTGEVTRDTVDGSSNTTFEKTITNIDFGQGKDTTGLIKVEVTAENAQYGKVTQVVEVPKPPKVKDPSQASETIRLEPMTLKLGQRPKLRAEMDFADYVKKNQSDPKVANFKGLLLEEVVTISLYPILNYVFFDEGSATIPSRYILFKSPAETKNFSDERIPGGTLEKYYHMLNIVGYRLNKYPQAKIVVRGCNDQGSASEKAPGLSAKRAQIVYDYLKNIWGISPDRMQLVGDKNLPDVVSNLKDSLGIVENRRTEILCDEWEVLRPILDKDPKRFPQPETMTFVMENGIDNNIVGSRRIEITHNGKPWKTLSDIGNDAKSTPWDWFNEDMELPAKKDESPFEARLIVTSKAGKECVSDPIKIAVKQVSTEDKAIVLNDDKTQETYNLILFPFNSYEPGNRNNLILTEYVFPRVFATTEVTIVGHTDVVGMFDYNKRLSGNRANAAAQAITKEKKGKFKNLNSSGVGEDEPLYTNDLPEGRFYNRTVQINISTPVKDTK